MSGIEIISGELVTALSLALAGIIIAAHILGFAVPFEEIILVSLAILVVCGVLFLLLNAKHRGTEDT